MGTDPQRPLPECLTRFLSAPDARPVVASPESARTVPPLPRNRAVRIAVAWAVLYNVAGFGLLYWTWTSLRVPVP